MIRRHRRVDTWSTLGRHFMCGRHLGLSLTLHAENRVNPALIFCRSGLSLSLKEGGKRGANNKIGSRQQQQRSTMVA
jgi:hypothetical protein